MIEELPRYFTSKEFRLICPDDSKFDIVEKIKNEFRNKYVINDIDGVRVSFENGWGLIRASNTQPELSIRFESSTKKGFENIKKILNDKLKKYSELKGILF